MSNAAKGCLEEMISENKYTVYPFLAYNILRKIINPKDYYKILAGVTVKLCFHLMYYTIAKHRDNRKQIKGNTFTTFVADIEQLRVLSLLKAITLPSKRKISAKDPATSSAKYSKKRTI